MGIEGIWLYWPGTHVRLTTVATAAVLFGVVLWRTRRPLLAVATVISWLSAYEIAWQSGQVEFHRDAAGPSIWLIGALAGWVLFANALGIRPNLYLVAIAAAAFAVWLLIGYQQNWPAKPFSLPVEVLNVTSKTALAAAYLLGAIGVSPAGNEPRSTSRAEWWRVLRPAPAGRGQSSRRP